MAAELGAFLKGFNLKKLWQATKAINPDKLHYFAFTLKMQIGARGYEKPEYRDIGHPYSYKKLLTD